jgi:hypothetical protein
MEHFLGCLKGAELRRVVPAEKAAICDGPSLGSCRIERRSQATAIRSLEVCHHSHNGRVKGDCETRGARNGGDLLRVVGVASQPDVEGFS